jgi:hypothetical protein
VSGSIPSEPLGSTDAEPTVGFVCCIESGFLEDQTVLMASSIRRFGGTMADAPIFAVSPRAGHEPSAATIDALRALGVEVVVEPLNVDHPGYGMANKFAAGLWVEERADTDILVFVDSDTMFCAEPTAFRLPPGIDLAMRPADRKDKGSAGPGDEREAYWQTMYELTGVTERPWVVTPAGQQRIRAYFNGGLVVMRRSERLFRAWYDDFLTLVRNDHLPREGLGYMDQISLAVLGSRRWDRTQLLDWRYNYPLPHRPALAEPARSAALEDMVHLHFHRWFGRRDFLDLVLPPFPGSSPVRSFIEPFLPLEPAVTGLPGPIRAERKSIGATREADVAKASSSRRFARRLLGRA